MSHDNTCLLQFIGNVLLVSTPGLALAASLVTGNHIDIACQGEMESKSSNARNISSSRKTEDLHDYHYNHQ